jgi:hypothetical protein
MNRAQTISSGAKATITIRLARAGMQKADSPEANQAYPYLWFWISRLSERKGQPYRVIACGRMNSVMVEFTDGFRVITSRYAVRKSNGTQ